jgi:hypothetical protein
MSRVWRHGSGLGVALIQALCAYSVPGYWRTNVFVYSRALTEWK